MQSDQKKSYLAIFKLTIEGKGNILRFWWNFVRFVKTILVGQKEVASENQNFYRTVVQRNLYIGQGVGIK
jgi:hypothetical protein